MRLIAVVNQKGGTAKTTTAVHLAAALGERGVSTLLVDLDPQASASAWLSAEPGGDGLLDALTNDTASLADLARPATAPGVEVVPASLSLAHAERELAAQPGGELALRELLAAAPAGRWEVVVMDCPPQLGRLTASALLAARELLVPVEASTMALAGLGALLDTLRRTRRRNAELRLAGIVVCRVDYRNRLSREVVRELGERFPEATLETVIRERVRLREAWSFRQPVTVYEPHGDAAEDYRRLAAEVLAREPEAVGGRS
jgi:chromosome partitioning protein